MKRYVISNALYLNNCLWNRWLCFSRSISGRFALGVRHMAHISCPWCCPRVSQFLVLVNRPSILGWCSFNSVCISKTPLYLWVLDVYLNSLGAIQADPSKSPRFIQDSVYVLGRYLYNIRKIQFFLWFGMHCFGSPYVFWLQQFPIKKSLRLERPNIPNSWPQRHGTLQKMTL